MSRVTDAAGFVLACVSGPQPRYLLLRSASHHDWGFPKGHVDAGETHEQAARREAAEETGIDDIEPVQGFAREIEYDAVSSRLGRYRKRVRYFLALTPATTHVLSAEHDDAGWFTLNEALQRLNHGQLKDLLIAADTALRSGH